MADREVDQSERDRAADSLDDRLGSAGPLEHEPHNGDETDENADAGELAQPELLRRRVEQRRIAVGQRFPVEESEDDGDEVADRSEDEEARVALGGLEMACDAEPDEEADVHAGVIPEKCSFAARILRGEALRQHHIDAGDVEAAAGEEEREADVEQAEVCRPRCMRSRTPAAPCRQQTGCGSKESGRPGNRRRGAGRS